MRPTLVALLAAAAALVAQEPPRPIVAKLGDLVNTVFNEKTYTVEYGVGLEVCPVVYRFDRKGQAREDLVSLCQALYLKCEFDEGKRTVSVTRGPRLAASARAQRWQNSVARLAKEVRPYLNADPKRIFVASRTLRRQAKEERDPWALQRLAQRDGWLRLLLESEGSLLVRSLVASPEGNARIMASRCAVGNQVTPSPDARTLWSAFARGDGFYSTDFNEPEEEANAIWEGFKEMNSERRAKASRILAQQPIPVIKHRDWSATLFLVTPTTSEFGVNLDLAEPSGPVALAPLPVDVARAPVRLQMPWPDGGRSLNGLAPLAGDLKLNFASWLSVNPLPSRIGASLEESRKFGFGLDATRAGSWLGIHNASDPLSQTSPGWGHFLHLLPHFEREEVLLARLEELKPAELRALEEIGVEGYYLLPERFRPLSAGIRLYRPALRWHLGGKGAVGKVTIPYEDLPKESRDDVREFLRSEYAFAFYPQLLHPANANQFRRVSLTVERGLVDGRLRLLSVGLAFPLDWNPVVQNSPIAFSIKTPVYPEGLTPWDRFSPESLHKRGPQPWMKRRGVFTQRSRRSGDHSQTLCVPLRILGALCVVLKKSGIAKDRDGYAEERHGSPHALGKVVSHGGISHEASGTRALRCSRGHEPSRGYI